jgi:hypothetical protein
VSWVEAADGSLINPAYIERVHIGTTSPTVWADGPEMSVVLRVFDTRDDAVAWMHEFAERVAEPTGTPARPVVMQPARRFGRPTNTRKAGEW